MAQFFSPTSAPHTGHRLPGLASNRPVGVALLLLAAAVALVLWRQDAAPNPEDGGVKSNQAQGSKAPADSRQGQQASHPTDGDPAVDSATDGDGELAILEHRHRILERMWWNRAKHFESIGLEPQLRARMDARLMEYLEASSEGSGRQNEAFRAFRRALTDGDWGTARERISALGTSHVAPLQLQAQMMVDVMEMLSSDQHRRLTENHAGLLSGPWLSNRTLRTGSRR